jgi:hypothetical protein
MMIMITMDWDYVSELLPPTGLFFIRQVIYEHGEPWWMMSTGENSLSVRKSALWKSYLQSYIVANREDEDEGNYGFFLQNISFI